MNVSKVRTVVRDVLKWTIRRSVNTGVQAVFAATAVSPFPLVPGDLPGCM